MDLPAVAPFRDNPDVLIIGGGVVGLFCAFFLCRAGFSVSVAERGAVGGPSSCSSRNTGFVGTQGAAPLAEPGVPAQALRWLLNPQSPFAIRPRLDSELLRWLWHFQRACNRQDASVSSRLLLELKLRSLEILRELCLTGSLTPSFTTSGILLAYKTQAGFRKACRAMPQAVAEGVPLRVLDPAELHALAPEATFDICGAVYNEDGAALRVPGFMLEFARMLEGMGVEIHPGTEVTGFAVSGGEIRQVRTTRGDFRPGETVISAGTWSAECARQLGVRLTLQPAKGYIVEVKAPINAPRLPALLTEGKVALMPLGDHLRLGGTLELSGMSSAVDSRRVAGVLHTVWAYLPQLEATEIIDTWSGFRPCTPDGLPFIGRAGSYHNLSIACGHSHIGMGLAPATGQMIAQIIAGKQPDIDPAPYRVGRYDGWRRLP